MLQRINLWRGLEKLPPKFWILFSATVINRAGMMALPFLILYLTKGLNFSPSDASWIFLCYGIGSTITGPIAGRLVDRFGALFIMRFSLLSSGVILSVYPFFSSNVNIVLMTIVWAMTSEAFRPAALTAVNRIVPAEQKKDAIVAYRISINLGMSIGPVIGGSLAMISYPLIFWVDGATALLAGFVLLMFSWTELSSQKAKSMGSALNDSRLWYFLIAISLTLIVFFQMEGAVPLFIVNDIRLTEFDYGLLLAVNTVIIIVIEFYLNQRLSHWSLRKSMAAGGILVALGFGSMIAVIDFWTAAVTVAIWTFGEMLLFPSAVTYLSEIAPAGREGEYMGYNQMAFSSGVM